MISDHNVFMRVKKYSRGLTAALVFFGFSTALYAQCGCGSDVAFTQNPEFAGPYAAATTAVDVNLGNSAATFVTEAYWQAYGSAPSAGTVNTQVNNLMTLPYWRRIDVINTFMSGAGKSLPKIYSEPWQSEPPFLNPPCKSVARDVGAVCMFFFSCPGGTNCSMDWADTHVEGMSGPSTLLAYGANSTGYYTSSSDAGFWYRELMDARYAGLSYLLPNCYGPDITNGSIDNLASALGTINSMGVTAQVKIGMFDDTSGWNNPADFNFAPWNAGPWSISSGPENLSAAGVTAAANEIFQDKWQPFFSRIPSQYWYEVNGHPLITVYYGGTLYIDGSSQPTVATIIQLLKNDFQTAFGVTPYVVIDIGFSYGSATVADNQFVWNTLSSPYVPATNLSTYTNGGITADLAMVKWDPTQRDNGSTAIANPTCEGTTLIKNDSLLQSILSRTTNDTFLTLATWNDLGEGTGINRNYDYYVNGQWQPPDYFMNDIRHSQAQLTCVPGTPTNTPVNTATKTPTATYSATPSSTPTQTFTATRTASPTATLTASLTPTATQTHTATPVFTGTPTATAVLTGTSTFTFSPTNTATVQSTMTFSLTPTGTATTALTPTRTATASATLTLTSTSTFTPTRTLAMTATPSFTGTPTFSPTTTLTFTRTFTGTATATFSSTFSATPTWSPTATATFSFTPTPVFTNSFTPTFSPTPTFSTTATLTPTFSRTPTVTPTWTFTATATRIPVVLYPNPVTGPGPVRVSVPLSAGRVSVSIFTTAFRKVQSESFSGASGFVSVSLLDHGGLQLANGLYYVVVETEGSRTIDKLMILR